MALAIVVLELLIRGIMFDQGTTKDHPHLPLGWDETDFIRTAAITQVDNNSEPKYKLSCREVLSGCLQVFKKRDFQMSVAM